MKNIYFLTFFIFFIHISAQEITDSLLLNYKFDNTFGDSSGNNHDGENYGGTFIEDRFGRQDSALYFNGIDSYLLFPNLDVLKPQLPVSFSFWVKYDSMDGDYAYLLSTSFEYNRSSGIYFNTQMSTGKYAVNYGDGTYFFNPTTRRTYISERVMDTADWHHIAVVVNSELDMKIYVDCKEYGGTYVGSGGELVYSNTPGNLGRGRRNGNAGINYFKGAIDDFYYWNRALTDNEVSGLCQNVEMGLQAYLTSEYKIVPNPVSNFFTLDSSKSEIESVIIYNSLGQAVLQERFKSNQIDVSFLPSGVYFVRVLTKKGGYKTLKFIKN